MKWLENQLPIKFVSGRSSASVPTAASWALVATATLLMACGDSEGSGGSPAAKYGDDEVRALHDDYCTWGCDCNGDCMCDYDDEELDADIASGCGDDAAALFECVLDHSCDEPVKMECGDQDDALSECRDEGG